MNSSILNCFSMGFVFLACLFVQVAQAIDYQWDEQQRQEREKYYQQQEFQRDQDRLRDQEELRKTQYEQEAKFQEEIKQLEVERQKLITPEKPYQPTNYPPRYHQHRVSPQKK